MHIKRIFEALVIVFLIAGSALSQSNILPPVSSSAPAPKLPVQPAPDLGRQLEKLLHKDDGSNNKLGEEADSNQIVLNFKDVPLSEAITVLAKQSGMNVTLDKDIDTKLTVTTVYSGTSIENALRSITTGTDVSYKKAPGGFLVVPWTEAYIDVNKTYQFSGTGSAQSPPVGAVNQPFQQSSYAGGVVGSQMATLIQPGQSGSSSVAISDFGGYMDSVISMIKPILSKQGVVTYMPSGFIYVRDSPSRVKAVEAMFDVDNQKRDEVDIKITILRIDYKKEYESGIDWSKAFQGFKVGSPAAYNVNSNFLGDLAGQTANVLTFGYTNPLKNINITAQMLARYGNVKVVHSWETRAMTGSVIPFDLTQLVWYSAGSVIQVINNQTITTPQVSNTPVGLSIILNPVKYEDKYLVNTKIQMSSVISQQTIGDLTFPNIENNAVSVPIKLLSGEQVAISGFKIKSSTKNTVGIPILSQLPILEYLFGYKTAQNETSEIAVVISLNCKKTGKEI